MRRVLAAAVSIAWGMSAVAGTEPTVGRPRAREAGIVTGVLSPGPLNAITDVDGVRVGHATLTEGDDLRTGVTAILPHGGNLYAEPVPAAVFVANGFGKLTGVTQIDELGRLETPIALTGTLSTWRVADALAEWVLEQPGNEAVLSVNPVVGECNDGELSDVRRRPVGRDQLRAAIAGASPGPVAEGCVGGGTGTRCLGFKGGIGTASRRLPERFGGWTIGVLVQTNFGGELTVAGVPVGRTLAELPYSLRPQSADDGSCMIVIATDAPVDARQLGRLAARTPMGLARVGSFASHGSGDYAIAFSANPACRLRRGAAGSGRVELLPDEELSPVLLAVVEATEEAVINSLFAATTIRGRDGRVVEALPIERVQELLAERGVLASPAH